MGSQDVVELLYVEDNPADAELMLRALEKQNISPRLHHARDGVEALEFLGEAGAAVDTVAGLRLILLDLKLPRISGLEVLRRIRADERTRAIPVVILTSSCERSDIEAAYALGANSYVCKPVEFELFMDAVGRIGRYWLLLNERARG